MSHVVHSPAAAAPDSDGCESSTSLPSLYTLTPRPLHGWQNFCVSDSRDGSARVGGRSRLMPEGP